MFEKVVLVEVVVALVANPKEVPNLLHSVCTNDVVLRGMAKGEEELNLCLSVTSTPFTVGIRVGDGIGSGGSAINHVPESSVFED